jgi:predicted nucleic acid-binding protein
MKPCMGKMAHGKEGMPKTFEVLVDSDALVGWLWAADGHHQAATDLFHALEAASTQLVLTSFVVAETATVLSHRSGQPLARTFLDHVERSRIPIIHISERLQEEALRLFITQGKREMSVTDCANVVVMQQFSIPMIFSFDKAYSQLFNVEMTP